MYELSRDTIINTDATDLIMQSQYAGLSGGKQIHTTGRYVHTHLHVQLRYPSFSCRALGILPPSRRQLKQQTCAIG